MGIVPTPRRFQVAHRSPEPLSEAARRVLHRTATETELEELRHFITNARTRRILYELTRYCRGQQDGVSLLIAGTRGIGKTTLTRLVIQDIIINAKNQKGRADGPTMIPLPIYLHGPTLLKRWRDGEDKPPAWMEELRKPLRPPYPPQVSPFEEQWRQLAPSAALKKAVLRNLITELYQHLASALVDAWGNAIDRQVTGLWPRQQRELGQLRAHLDLKLDEAPDVKTLRQIWRRAGFLEDGVARHLYPGQEDAQAWVVDRRPRGDQGVREILALSACAISFLTILGNPTETLSNELSRIVGTHLSVAAQSPRPAEKPKPEPAKPDAAGPAGAGDRIAPALAAGAAAVAALATSPSFAGLLGAAALLVLGMVPFRFSRTVDKLATLRNTRTIDVDWSERRLERELPVLLARVKAAGFAPIFIVDELDKLAKPEDELHDFINVSKHIVRDHAAFLFLTDRSYMETLAEQERGQDDDA